MNTTHSNRRAQNREQKRIRFLVERDGEAAAREWVERTLENYRQAMESFTSHASFPEYRAHFKSSIKVFEEWLANHKASG